MTPHSLFDISVKTIDGRTQTLEPFRGSVLLIVNVASQCGFTPQYEDLEELYRRHKEAGLVVLGFPCDQFGHQEPDDEAAIQEFCSLNYGVSFPMFAKINVNGRAAHPLFQFLTKTKRGFLFSRAIKWNFTKFLIARDGTVVKRYGSTTSPVALEPGIVRLLRVG